MNQTTNLFHDKHLFCYIGSENRGPLKLGRSITCLSGIEDIEPKTKNKMGLNLEEVLAVFQQRSGGVVAKVGSLTPMLQPGATSAPGTPPQKVQKPSYEPFLLTSSDGCLNWVRTIDCPANWNRAKNGSLLLLLPSFWRESTFINRVHPSHNRITPVNITWALSIFAATHPSNIFYLSLHCLIPSSYDWSALYVHLKVWNRFLSRDTVFWASLSFGIMPQPTLSAIFIVDFQHLAWKLNCYFLFLQDRKYFHSALPATLKKRDKLSTNWEGHSRRGDGAEGKGKRLGGLV